MKDLKDITWLAAFTVMNVPVTLGWPIACYFVADYNVWANILFIYRLHNNMDYTC
jgi:hypothetical protein